MKIFKACEQSIGKKDTSDFIPWVEGPSVQYWMSPKDIHILI